MAVLEGDFALEPVQAFLALQRSRCIRDEVAIRGPWPIVKVVHEAVGLGIAVDVGDDSKEMSFVGDGDPFEGAFEERAGAVESLVEGFCIGVEAVSKATAGYFWRDRQHLSFNFAFFFHFD